VVISFLFGL